MAKKILGVAQGQVLQLDWIPSPLVIAAYRMPDFRRKLYALLQSPAQPAWSDSICTQLVCLNGHRENLENWWAAASLPPRIASASDRVNLHSISDPLLQACHPISGQRQTFPSPYPHSSLIPYCIRIEPSAEKVFWWFWRFYPELRAQTDSAALLTPAHTILPDCPLHSYQATVSALVGSLYPDPISDQSAAQSHPYLLLFSFSPVQEFIKSSRKFLDFWAGSYLLHYLSTRLCWLIAEQYGPDAVIVPSLWSQEIIDALLLRKYPEFQCQFASLVRDESTDEPTGKTPTQRFNDRTSSSLSTAGFPNVITAIVPGKAAAEELGKKLTDALKAEWSAIGQKVKEDIKKRVSGRLINGQWQELWAEIAADFPSPPNSPENFNPHERELEKYQQGGCWEWNVLWDNQLENTWEPYWTAIPLGFPKDSEFSGDLECSRQADLFDQDWIDHQQTIAQAPEDIHLPAAAERDFDTLNVGTWWGSIQQRLRLTLQAVKNTRTWQIPVAPGERSTISGQFSAVHPFFNYTKFPEGGGLPEGSMRLFWLVMSKAYPGLFNGSEHLNALELTKRMAWKYGDVANELGISTDFVEEPLPEEVVDELYNPAEADRSPITTIDYEKLIRFPNLSSIASARFAHDHPQKIQKYWKALAKLLSKNETLSHQRNVFGARTRCRPFHILKTDQALNSEQLKGQNYNGVMFSSKWLAEDMNLNQGETQTLRKLVDQAHKEAHFGDSSPADWWAIVLADGDGMGQYVSGQSLLSYEHYLNVEAIADSPAYLDELLKTKKRMGPATHVGLNRALLDFSNRLVPYLTEQRFCGKVIYSGGDDVMAVLPIEDLPEYLLSLRSAWRGDTDPYGEFNPSADSNNPEATGYWHPTDRVQGLPKRPHFTMGKNATMSMGIVIAHKSVPLPTVLESLWVAEKDRAKKMPGKDGLCFRVIYGSGNQLEAVMKGHLLQDWWNCISSYREYGDNLSPLLYRLAEELPRRACVTPSDRLFSKAAEVIMSRRDDTKQLPNFGAIRQWLDDWEAWAYEHGNAAGATDPPPLGTTPEDLGNLLRFTAFWVDKRVERWNWVNGSADEQEVQP